MNVFSRMWSDDAGYIISTEMLLIFVILVLGLISGWGALRQAIVQEFNESANAILNINQSFTIAALSGCNASNGGSTVVDNPASITIVQSAATSVTIDAILCP